MTRYGRIRSWLQQQEDELRQQLTAAQQHIADCDQSVMILQDEQKQFADQTSWHVHDQYERFCIGVATRIQVVRKRRAQIKLKLDQLRQEILALHRRRKSFIKLDQILEQKIAQKRASLAAKQLDERLVQQWWERVK